MATSVPAQAAPTPSPIAPQSSSPVQIDTPAAGGHILTVGTNGEFADLWDAIAQAHDNDVIAVQAGTYVDDSNSRQNGYVTAKNVTIEGVGGMVKIVEPTGGQPYNQKAPIVATNGLTIKNFDISGVTAHNLNGAGLRVDSGNLTVEDCYFHGNQDGILGAGSGNVVIDHSEFAFNGQGGGGSAHDVYIGSVDGAQTASLTFTNNYVHDSQDQGHLLKTRAQVNTIEGNVFADQQGNGSYDIDIPNGGVSTIQGNLIVKGPNTVNAYVIHYGGENQFSYATNSLSVTGNTIAYERGTPSSAVGVYNQISVTTGKAAVPVSVTNNALYNLPVSDVLAGAGTVTGSTVLQSAPVIPTASPWASAPVIQGPTSPLTLVLDNPVGVAHGISGGSTGATITDNVGATINSGSVGIRLTENQTGQITTRAGTTNAIILNGGGSTLTSAGTDTVTDNGKGATITLSGQSTLNIGSAAWGYTVTLNGQEAVTTAADGVFRIGAGANVTISTVSGGYAFTKPSGATLAVNESYIQYGTTFTAYATSSGGATQLSWANYVLTLTAQDAAADSFTYRGGSVAVVAGKGADTITVAAGQHPGSLEIKGYKVGTDSIVYQGYSGNPVTSARLVGGNTVLTLVDGSTIQVDGVALSMAVAAPSVIQGSTVGSGADTLTVSLSEDAYQGNAQASISIDGKLLTATPVTVTAGKSAGQTQVFTFKGNFGTGPHKVVVTFLNDAWGGSSATDRNLYVDGVSLNGVSAGVGATVAGTTSTLGTSTELHTMNSAVGFSVTGGTSAAASTATATTTTTASATKPSSVPPVNGGTFGTGPDTLVVTLAEDAYQGSAQASISIDGKTLTATPVAVTAPYAQGGSETFTFKGTFGTGTHQVGVSFLNDAWGGSSASDRNLYVEGVSLNGTSAGAPKSATSTITSPVSGTTELHTAGNASYSVTGGTSAASSTTTAEPFATKLSSAPPVNGGTFGTGPDTLVVTLAEDAYQGSAQASISIDGKTLTATPVAVTAPYAQGGSETFTFKGTFGTGMHQVGVSFLNDAWGGSSASDRNLYVEGVSLNGTSAGAPKSATSTVTSPADGTTELHTAGSATYSVSGGTSPAQGAASSATEAVTFASGQYVTAGNVLQYDSNQPWSATAEVEFNGPAPGVGPDLPQGGAELVFGNTNGAPYQGYELWEDDSGDLRVRIMSNYLAGSYIDVATTSPVSYGTMQFIGATYDGSGKAAGVSIYVNGQKAQTQVLSDTLSGSSASSGPMVIGNQLNGWQDQFNLQGTMAEFSLSNVDRSASYFTSSAQQGAFATDANTQLAYGFAEGAGLTTQDLSGHGNNGALSSAAMWAKMS